jgi:hypothetical protein
VPGLHWCARIEVFEDFELYPAGLHPEDLAGAHYGHTITRQQVGHRLSVEHEPVEPEPAAQSVSHAVPTRLELEPDGTSYSRVFQPLWPTRRVQRSPRTGSI